MTMDNKKRKISGEEFLTKLKDDGDFDKLRLKIIRKLKDDAELRDNIISMVKQSAALNRPGAETMKPRQLSDAIHEEIGNKVMSQISHGVWKIIRSGGEMNTEIRDTVQSVYTKLSNPKVNEDGESSVQPDLLPECRRHDVNGSVAVSASETNVRGPEGEANKPPGFSLNGQGWNNKSSLEDRRPGKRLPMSRPCDGKAREGEPNEPPGFRLNGQGWNDKSSHEDRRPGKRLSMPRPWDGKARAGEPNEPPGFIQNGQDRNNKSIHEDRQTGKRLPMSRPCDGKARVELIKETTSSSDRMELQNVYNDVQPCYHQVVEKQLDEGSDDDLDVPPGFG